MSNVSRAASPLYPLSSQERGYRGEDQERGYGGEVVVLLLLFLLLLASCSPVERTEEGSDKYLIAYMMGARDGEYPDSLIRMLTHINYAFAQVVDGEIIFHSRSDEHTERIRQSVARVMDFREVHPDIKILISVGGWGAEGFSDAALTDSTRRRFAVSGARLVREYGFDGIDLDWEYPGQIGGGNVYRPEDKQNFTLMLRDLRLELERLALETGRHRTDPMLLTIATGADQAYMDHTDMAEAQRYLDFINIMTYDFHSGLHPVAGHHSNLYKSAIPNATDISTEIAVDRHIANGIPAEKLVIGVPFYARLWYGVPAENGGMYTPAGSIGHAMHYNTMRREWMTLQGFTRHWDSTAQVPWLHSPDSAMVFSYDDPQSLRLKVQFLKQRGLAGIMFWEWHGDDEGELLRTIYGEL